MAILLWTNYHPPSGDSRSESRLLTDPYMDDKYEGLYPNKVKFIQ